MSDDSHHPVGYSADVRMALNDIGALTIGDSVNTSDPPSGFYRLAIRKAGEFPCAGLALDRVGIARVGGAGQADSYDGVVSGYRQRGRWSIPCGAVRGCARTQCRGTSRSSDTYMYTATSRSAAGSRLLRRVRCSVGSSVALRARARASGMPGHELEPT
jgi:hypothetical protein